jgi:hypothetical protein
MLGICLFPRAENTRESCSGKRERGLTGSIEATEAATGGASKDLLIALLCAPASCNLLP